MTVELSAIYKAEYIGNVIKGIKPEELKFKLYHLTDQDREILVKLSRIYTENFDFTKESVEDLNPVRIEKIAGILKDAPNGIVSDDSGVLRGLKEAQEMQRQPVKMGETEKYLNDVPLFSFKFNLEVSRGIYRLGELETIRKQKYAELDAGDEKVAALREKIELFKFAQSLGIAPANIQHTMKEMLLLGPEILNDMRSLKPRFTDEDVNALRKKWQDSIDRLNQEVNALEKDLAEASIACFVLSNRINRYTLLKTTLGTKGCDYIFYSYRVDDRYSEEEIEASLEKLRTEDPIGYRLNYKFRWYGISACNRAAVDPQRDHD